MPSTTRAPIFYKRNTPLAMTDAHALPLGVPAFKPLRTAVTTNIQTMLRKTDYPTTAGITRINGTPNLAVANATFIQTQLQRQYPGMTQANPMVISPQANAFKVPVPAFQALPASVSRISNGQIVHANSDLRKTFASNAIDNGGYSTIQRIDVRNLLNFNLKIKSEMLN